MNLHDIGYAFVGGICIGLAAILLLVTDGKIAGISGMIGGLMRPRSNQVGWRLAFLAGLVSGGLVFHGLGFRVYEPIAGHSYTFLILAGLLVGFGTQLGSGCTSGHGVCGLGRFSMRSLVAT